MTHKQCAIRSIRRAVLLRCLLLCVLVTGPLASQKQPPTDEDIAAWFRSAQEAHARGDLAAAAAEYEKVARARPDIAEVHSNLGLVYYMQSRLPEALSSFQEARKRKPELFVPLLFSGVSHVRMRQFEPAAPLLEQALRDQPKDFQTLLYLAICYNNLNQELRANQYFEKLAELYPEEIEALYHLGRSYLDLSIHNFEALKEQASGSYLYQRALAQLDETQGKPLADVRSRYEKAIALQPTHAALHWELAQLLVRGNDPESAFPVLLKVLDLEPDCFAALLFLANLHVKAGDKDKARDRLAQVERILASLPSTDDDFAEFLAKEPDRGLSLLRALLWRGELEVRPRGMSSLAKTTARVWELIQARPREDAPLETYARLRIQQGELRLVRDQLLELVREFEDWPMPHFLLGDLYRRLSLVAHERMIALSPDGARTHLLRAEALENQYKDDEAIGAYRAAIVAQPDMPLLHYKLGTLLGHLRLFPEAIRAFEQELRIDPYQALARVRLAEVYIYQQQPQQAVPLLREAIEQDPTISSAYYALGRAHLLLEEPEKAAPMIEKALQLDPANRNAHYELARVYQVLGRREEAGRHFARFRELLGQPVLSRPQGLLKSEAPDEDER